ncbi:hypothetical protein C8J57DRAFT_1563738 [Mycena rebaudengoi]|nr:hypothetical protein C8J57DRAFT_1631990 [Mycena rebaudengoi]KAJ7280723.1 hypothetical protein C8J57DRAFT_1563738 [Mycena rebaudengoi]
MYDAAYRKKSSLEIILMKFKRLRSAQAVNAARRARGNDIAAPGMKAPQNRSDEPGFNKRTVWKYEQRTLDSGSRRKARGRVVGAQLVALLSSKLFTGHSVPMTDPHHLDSLLSDMTPSRNRSASNGRSTRSHIRERMTDLDAQVLALEQAPEAVRLERQDLQTRLDAYKYPILTLPIEITSEIFVHFLPPYPERPPALGLSSPHILGHICRTWREIAFSTPRLWRAINLSLPTKSPTKALDLLRTWVSRSKDCPLSISLKSFTRQLDIDFI